MALSLNLHRLVADEDGYLRKLRVDDAEAKALRKARETIRDALRDAFQDWSAHVTRVELFDSVLAKSNADLTLPAPKFRVQGSFAYYTVNDCQQTPPQQIDLDDGVFLPIDFLMQSGTTRPAVAAKAYFKLVEDALRPVCVSNGWTLKQKRTCVRVEIASRLHIDLPLYAIRETSFRELTETASMNLTKSFDVLDAEIMFAEDVYRGIPDADIMLACRERENVGHHWFASDPRRLEDWFTNAVATFGPQTRRLARSFKGMRDAKWQTGGPSSICLMAGVVKALEALRGSPSPDRDDLAFVAVARKMADLMAGPIANPVFPGEADKCLCKDWTPQFRQEVIDTLRYAAEQLRAGIEDTLHPAVAITHAQKALGPRVPNDHSLVRQVGTAAAVRATPAEIQPQPIPVRTRSG